MSATRGGVYHNLRLSKYVVSDDSLEITFFFSSRKKMEMFLDKHRKNRELLDERLERTFRELEIDFSLLSDIYCYKECETRGFYVWLRGREIEWQDLLEYVLLNVTETSSKDWREIQKPKLEERLKIME